MQNLKYSATLVPIFVRSCRFSVSNKGGKFYFIASYNTKTDKFRVEQCSTGTGARYPFPGDDESHEFTFKDSEYHKMRSEDIFDYHIRAVKEEFDLALGKVATGIEDTDLTSDNWLDIVDWFRDEGIEHLLQ